MTCYCGLKIQQGHLARHIKSLWHREHLRIERMRDMGLTQAEIGRQFMVSRMYISKLLRKRKHG